MTPFRRRLVGASRPTRKVAFAKPLYHEPGGEACGAAGRDRSEALLLERLRLRAAATWLEARHRLGRDVSPRPVPPRERAGNLLDLLEGVLLIMDGPRRPANLPDRYRPTLFRGWPVAGAHARILGLLAGSGHSPVSLLQCLPEEDPAPEATISILPGEQPADPIRRLRRNWIGSLFSAALELAKKGAAHLG